MIREEKLMRNLADLYRNLRDQAKSGPQIVFHADPKVAAAAAINVRNWRFY